MSNQNPTATNLGPSEMQKILLQVLDSSATLPLALSVSKMLQQAFALYPQASGYPTTETILFIAAVWANDLAAESVPAAMVTTLFRELRADRRSKGDKLNFMPSCDELIAQWDKRRPSQADKIAAAKFEASEKMMDDQFGGREKRMELKRMTAERQALPAAVRHLPALQHVAGAVSVGAAIPLPELGMPAAKRVPSTNGADYLDRMRHRIATDPDSVPADVREAVLNPKPIALDGAA